MNRIVAFIIAKQRKKNIKLNIFDVAPQTYQYCYSKFDLCRKYYELNKNYENVKVYCNENTI